MQLHNWKLHKAEVDQNQIIIFVIIDPKHVTRGEVRLRATAPGPLSSGETSQRWRAVNYTRSDLTGPGNEPTPPAPIAMSSATATAGS